MPRSLLVLGSGPAGVEAALAAAPHAQRVILVGEGPVADWGKLLSSRIWLSALDHLADRSPHAVPDCFSLSDLRAQTTACARRWSQHYQELLRRADVELVAGRARFTGPEKIEIKGNGRVLHADRVLITTGGIPSFPPGFDPDGERVFSPHTIEKMRALPRRLVLLGDGPIGFEYAHIFSWLGAEIDWLALPGGPRTGLDASVDEYLMALLKARGLRPYDASPIEQVQRALDGVIVRCQNGDSFVGDALFLSTGARPALDALDLDKAGLAVNAHGQLDLDAYGQTAVSSIYSHRPGPVNFVQAQARVAALHALGQEVEPFDCLSAVVPFSHRPQVAQVGALSGEDLTSATIPFAASLKTHVDAQPDGFFKIAWDEERRIRGACAVGLGAADALTPIAVAIKTSAAIDDLAAIYGPHPSVGELSFVAARRAVEIAAQA